LSEFEHVLAVVCSKCEYAYGAMGRVGFSYDSAKDQLKWSDLSVKKWVSLVMEVGRYMALDDKDWKKIKAPKTEGTAGMAAALVAAFGDGKQKTNHKK